MKIKKFEVTINMKKRNIGKMMNFLSAIYLQMCFGKFNKTFGLKPVTDYFPGFMPGEFPFNPSMIEYLIRSAVVFSFNF